MKTNKERSEWLQELLQELKIGDLVAKNYGSFRKSLAYVVTEITDKKIVCRLLRNEHSKELIRKNRNYCRREMVLELDIKGNLISNITFDRMSN